MSESGAAVVSTGRRWPWLAGLLLLLLLLLLLAAAATATLSQMSRRGRSQGALTGAKWVSGAKKTVGQ